MRRFIYLLSSMLIFAGSLLAQARSDQQPFTIRIRAEEPAFKTSADIYIKVEMKNISNHPVDCSRAPTNGWDAAYRYEVLDNRGNRLERKLLVPGHPEIKESSSVWPCVLQPGESTHDDVIISRRYDMTKAGKYKVSVSRYIPDDPKNAIVKSNIVTIEITP